MSHSCQFLSCQLNKCQFINVSIAFDSYSQAEKRLKIFQEAERKYLKAALGTACKLLADQYLLGATADSTGGVFEPDVKRFEATQGPMPPFFHPELYTEHHLLMPDDAAFGHQDATADSSSSSEPFASLSSEDFKSLDEDPVETYLILDNSES